MRFEQALVALKQNKRVMRKKWNGKGLWIELCRPNGGRVLPYLYLHTMTGDLVPWLASRCCSCKTDMLAEDWVVMK